LPAVFVTFAKSNAKALLTAVPSIKNADLQAGFAPCRGLCCLRQSLSTPVRFRRAAASPFSLISHSQGHVTPLSIADNQETAAWV